MTAIDRIEVVWSGQPGLPGVSVFYATPAGSAVADIRTFFNSIKAAFTNTLTWSFPSSGDQIDDATGTLLGGWAGSPGGGAVTGTATGNYAAGCGGYVTWGTNAINNGRRLKGRTFLTNLSSAMYDSTGTIDNGILTLVDTAATALIAGGDLRVWHRPLPGGSNGNSTVVLTGQMADQVTSLRSRRR